MHFHYVTYGHAQGQETLPRGSGNLKWLGTYAYSQVGVNLSVYLVPTNFKPIWNAQFRFTADLVRFKLTPGLTPFWKTGNRQLFLVCDGKDCCYIPSLHSWNHEVHAVDLLICHHQDSLHSVTENSH